MSTSGARTVPAADSPAARTDPAADSPARTPEPRAGLIIGILVVSALVMILNETILSVGLKSLGTDLGIPTTSVAWLTSGFLLTMAVVVPLSGYLLERFTPRRVFLTALTLFTAGTALGAVAPGFEILLGARIVQAVGTAMTLPMLMTLAMRLAPPERRGTTMGTISIVIAAAPALGPTVGGLLLEFLGWRSLFWTVLPLALAVLAAGAIWLRADAATRRPPLDVASVFLSAVGFAALVYGLSSLDGSGLAGWAWTVLGAVVVAAFVVRQLHLQGRDRALLDLRAFTDRRFTVSVTLSVPLFMTLLGTTAVLLPLHLQVVLGVSVFASGLAVLPGGLVLAALSRPVGRLYDRVGARPLVPPGTIVMAAALASFAFFGPTTPLAVVIGAHVLLMAGVGLAMSPVMTEALGDLPAHLTAHGSAILNTVQQVAGSLGTTVFVTVAVAAGSDPSGGVPDAAGLHVAFLAAGGVVVLAVLVSLLLGPRRKATA